MNDTEVDTPGSSSLEDSADGLGLPFLAYLHEIRDLAQVGSDDIVGLMHPLLTQVVATHEQGRVAPLDGVDALRVSMGHLWFANAQTTVPSENRHAVRKLENAAPTKNIEVTRVVHINDDVDGWDKGLPQDTRVAGLEESPRLAYHLNYIAWEQQLDHHDALTDTFVLGMVMGSLATNLDLTNANELQQFVAARSDLCSVNKRLSPVIAQLIERMTELSRSARPQDLSAVAAALANYRYQELEDNIDAVPIPKTGSRRQLLLDRLRNRLFEVSRRNRLLYYRETGSTANLTVGSVPHVLNVESIRMQQLLYTNDALCDILASGKPLRLDRWLRFEDYPFLGVSLDRIRLQANRDIKEYGFSQLRLVTAFLRWHNLKDTPNERIVSPLILIPTTIKKRKGVRDSFELSAEAQEGEINPALKHYLGELYGIRLPDRIDATSMDEIRALTDSLRKQLTASEKGIELELVEEPRIQLIKRKAMRRLDRYRRKVRKTGRGLKSYSGISYSYSGQRFEPLGIQIFARDVRPANAPNRELLETESQPRIIEHMSSPAVSVERDFYSIDSGEEKSSTQWEVDLSSTSLANFSYRKMTLVRDYMELTDKDGTEQTNFDQLFSEQVRPIFQTLTVPPPAEQYNVLPADPSQQAAVLRARNSDSYVIQGPPGTGKSQTITNLIVDYVARGKSVLFVCEKRAALDVVFHRLQQVGLSDACCLIHDTREDKKPFISALKQRYEQAVATPPMAALASARHDWLTRKQKVLDVLETFTNAMTLADADNQQPLRSIIGHWVESGAIRPDIDARRRSQLPPWEAFRPVRERSASLRDTLQRRGYDGVLARSPIRYLRCDIGQQNDSLNFIESSALRALNALDAIDSVERDVAKILSGGVVSWSELLAAFEIVKQLAPFAEAGSLPALDVDAPTARRVRKKLKKTDKLSATFLQAQTNAEGWQSSESLEQVNKLLTCAKEKEGKFFAFLSGTWRKAKAVVRNSYSGKAKSVTDALSLLAHHLTSEQNLLACNVELRELLKLSEDDSLEECCALLGKVYDSSVELSAVQRDFLNLCIEDPSADRMILKLSSSGGGVRRANDELQLLLRDYDAEPQLELKKIVQQLVDDPTACDEYSEDLAALATLEPSALKAFRTFDCPFETLEIAVLDETVRKRLRKTSRFDAETLNRLLNKLAELAEEGRELNAKWAMNVCAENFHQHLVRASESMANTSAQEKDWRRAYTRGRKTLEREFEKSRAHRSVRELFANETGPVLRDLRPVWLMSPLSVADALPLDDTLFDVVVFDEASQIPLEDAIPTINRARQMIVVGDEMQLPPSRFFSGKAPNAEDDDDDTLPDVVLFDLNADSFLTRASAALPSTLLAWHYRSKHESLIGFCNQAFYAGNLKTIPTPGDLKQREPIVVEEHQASHTLREDLFERPISYHRLIDSPYEGQRNAGEARYIANLVRELLADTREPTIGIVAFSQAQQAEIESALSALAADDRGFRNKLDLEEERKEDDQFVGLFVKNLENVQGDERDVIILSVCYGPNSKGRMIMNFGPINQNGGHKRLNVIFSRAKKNMMVVSSIDAEKITNTYNEGANALRQYLSYASAVSIGDVQGMLAALNEYGTAAVDLDTSTSALALQHQVREALQTKGYDVASNYGQSGLRCHLAVRRNANEAYQLAILIDDSSHYAVEDVETRYTNSRTILQAFGWRVEYVLGKDWYEDKESTIARLCSQITAPDFSE